MKIRYLEGLRDEEGLRRQPQGRPAQGGPSALLSFLPFGLTISLAAAAARTLLLVFQGAGGSDSSPIIRESPQQRVVAHSLAQTLSHPLGPPGDEGKQS